MRWWQAQFALFAVIAVAAGLLSGPFVPAHAADPVETETVLLWRDQSGQPAGPTKFFVSVSSAAGTARPNGGSVVISLDGKAQPPIDLIPGQAGEDPVDPKGRITPDVLIDIGFGPHYFTTRYQGNADFKASDDDLGLATAKLEATPEPSQDTDQSTYTFTLAISPSTPLSRRPHGRVAFTDDDGHTTAPNDPFLGDDLQETWRVAQRQGRWTVTADYSPSADGTDFFLPINVTRAHQVNAAPGVSTTTSTTRRTTVTTRRPSTVTTRRNGTAALAPINPSSTTTPPPPNSTNTAAPSGTFPTSPPLSNDLAANQNKNDGPPIAVVVTTLLALGVLGGIAAFRRYRRGAVDWF
jgi:hypothetical protein